jgi:MerR family mercuric resistance operon transcriptional regulator
LAKPAAKQMTIGVLAAQGGVGVETVRYYQRRKLMPEPPRPYGGVRRYSQADLRRLRCIRHARELGFSLTEIEDLLKLDDGLDCEQAQRIAEDKRMTIRERIDRLQKIDHVLSQLLLQCQTQSKASCPMIQVLGEPDSPLQE